MIEVDCIPIRNLYRSDDNDFMVWACKPIGKDNEKVKLSKYKTFTVAGEGLSFLREENRVGLMLEKNEDERYDCSYTVVGLKGIAVVDGKVTISQDDEFQFLKQFMSERQAESVNNAYPDFIQRVLSGQEDTIDIKNIKHVGEKLFAKYVEDIKGKCSGFYMMSETMKYGIKDFDCAMKAGEIYKYPENFRCCIDKDPYNVYSKVTLWSFARIDKAVCYHFPELEESEIRCVAVCEYFLKQNEQDGDTRIKAGALANLVTDFDDRLKPFVFKAVTESRLFYYDKESKYVALKGTYEDEKTISEIIKSKINMPKLKMDADEFRKVDDFELTDEQAEILKTVQDYGICVLNGSSGSGKSSSTKALIRMIERTGYSYTLLAPTGIAAKVLRRATGREVSTIAMNLVTNADIGRFLVVDECSMIGVHTLAALLRKTDDTTRIIFVCDTNQLAPIECGNPIQDIISSGLVPCVTLTKVFRYGKGGIATFSTDARECKDLDFNQKFSDTTMDFLEGTDDILEDVVSSYKLGLEKYGKQDILCLCPFNKSSLGSLAINNAIQKAINNGKDTTVSFEKDGISVTLKIGDRVINKKNNYHAQLVDSEDEEGNEIFIANGDIGTIVKEEIEYDPEKPDEEIYYGLHVQFDSGLVCFSRKDVKNLLLGYCISCHSSQGCEAPYVIFVASKRHASMLTSNLVYVALSRAKKQLTIIGDGDTINEGVKIKENLLRNTWLKDMMEDNNGCS